MKAKPLTSFNSLLEMMDYLNTEEKCIQYYQQLRWDGVPVCPHCDTDKVYCFSDGKRFKCADCKKQFTVRVGTIYQDSKVSLRKWFMATYLLACNKKGISSYQLARDIKVTQKTSWFMLHRLRHQFGMGNQLEQQMSGTIQLDETFVGGKNKNRHKDKKVEKCQGRSFKDKTPVMGMLEQGEHEIVWRDHKTIPNTFVKEKIVIKQSVVHCVVVRDTSATSLQPIIKRSVKKDSILISDEWCGYYGLENRYDHRVIDHRAKQYVDEAGNTTNALEGFWTLLKRAYIGIYHFMSRKYLFQYANEVSYRFNTRRMTDCQRFEYSLIIKHTPLKYKELTGKAA